MIPHTAHDLQMMCVAAAHKAEHHPDQLDRQRAFDDADRLDAIVMAARDCGLGHREVIAGFLLQQNAAQAEKTEKRTRLDCAQSAASVARSAAQRFRKIADEFEELAKPRS